MWNFISLYITLFFNSETAQKSLADLLWFTSEETYIKKFRKLKFHIEQESSSQQWSTDPEAGS